MSARREQCRILEDLVADNLAPKTRSSQRLKRSEKADMPVKAMVVTNRSARLTRALLMLALLFLTEHIVCGFANAYTTRTYLALATDPGTAAQYSRPLHDVFFVGDREEGRQVGTGILLSLLFDTFHPPDLTFPPSPA